MIIKEITLQDWDVYDDNNKFEFLALQGIKPHEGLSDEFCLAVMDKYGDRGKEEIIRMEDRGQIFLRQAQRLLGDEYVTFSRRVPVER
ncbi:hypothetical protein MLC52_05325 [Sulfurimonas sp. NW15]|uniref:hypothetical protein n=1 Tax=Sulfurimonas sp. NW15 TaxID=2922729 RepID=UPI003DA9EE4A